jgi:hypothetical protein
MFLLLLKKSVKSLQLILNEFVLETNKDFSITAGAFTKARKKLKHTAFVELNDDIIEIYYQDNDIKRYRDLRVLAFDGSRITLPNSVEIKEEFGTRAVGNGTGTGIGEYTRATYMACYDVLNNISVQSTLGPCEAYEPDLTTGMIDKLSNDDLSIFDRGFAAYPFMAYLINSNKQFIIRCPKSSFGVIQEMFDDDAPNSKIVTINVPYKHKTKMTELKLPASIKLRLVKVLLSSGEIEVLATSLYDSDEFKSDDFKHLYFLRWGVETYFSKIKGRLNLENFSGKTVESIRQDFWSTIFMSNLETIMTEGVERELTKTSGKKFKTNKAVSFNAIKNLALDIFYRKRNSEDVFCKLDRLFKMNPILVRKNREVPRENISNTRSFNYQKRIRKHVF